MQKFTRGDHEGKKKGVNDRSADLLYEEQVGDISFALKMSQVKISFSSVRLVLTLTKLIFI